MSNNVTADGVRRRLGSSDLSDTEIDAEIGIAERAYDQRRDGEHVEEDVRDDVIEALRLRRRTADRQWWRG